MVPAVNRLGTNAQVGGGCLLGTPWLAGVDGSAAGQRWGVFFVLHCRPYPLWTGLQRLPTTPIAGYAQPDVRLDGGEAPRGYSSALFGTEGLAVTRHGRSLRVGRWTNLRNCGEADSMG